MAPRRLPRLRRRPPCPFASPAATAIGLFAAIPAVLAYNKLQAEVAKAQSRLETFADEFSAILSRQIDERMALAA